jgi:hypothetical protein
MTTLSKPDLEQMLHFLDLDTLGIIDSKCRQDAYTFGNRPLLKYSAEALTEYASALYRYILPHFGTIELTEDDYIALWLAPYTNIKAQLASKAEDFIGLLRNIAETPIESEPNTLPPVPNQVYAEIIDYLSGKNDDLYSNLNEFLFSTYSPLRKEIMTDARVLAIIAEADAIRDSGNKALIAFIGTQLTLTEQATAAVYGRSVSKPKYGTELKRLRQPILDRLAYFNLTPADILSITAHKDQLSQKEWSIVEQALASEILSPKVDKAITKLKKLIKGANKLSFKLPELREISKTKYLLSDEDYAAVDQLLHSLADWNLDADRIIDQYDANVKTCMSSADYQALCAKLSIAKHLTDHYCDPSQSEYKALEPYVTLSHHKDQASAKQLIQSQSEIHAVTTDIHKLFIRSFVSSVESAYSKLEPISIFALVDAEKDSFTDCNPEETERRRQTMTNLLAREGYNTDWFYDYTDIIKPLSDCLNITLNDLTICPDALVHGAVVGMIEWCEQIKAQLIAVSEENTLDFDYTALAKDLRVKMQYHTLACNSADYLMVTDTGLTRVEGKSAEYINDRITSSSKPTDLLVHNATYGIVKVCEPAPLPEIVPTDAEQQLSTTQHTYSGFNRTQPIQELMNKLQPDTIFSVHEEQFLSEDEVASLKPVPDEALAELLTFLAGKRCDVYMLRGDLIAHTATGEYIKIIPKINKKSKKGHYMTYTFTAVNWTILEKLIKNYANLLRDTDCYDDIATTLTARKSYEIHGETRVKRLNNRYRRYREDVKFLSELQDLADEIYKDTDKKALVESMRQTIYYNTYYISQSYLVMWVYKPAEYVKKLGQVIVDTDGIILNYEIHHKDKDPRNNDPDNLEILSEYEHDPLKSNCNPVIYNGLTYPSVSDYCEITSAGAYTKLQQALSGLKSSVSVTSKGRDYCTDPDTGVYIATDSIPQVSFNGILFATPRDFAKAKKLSPDALCLKLKRAREKGTEIFRYKGFGFELLEDNSIKITC